MQLNIPVVGILRGISPSFFHKLMPAAFNAGLEAIEVTMNTDGAVNIIRDNLPAVPAGKFLGMGTICSIDEAKAAIDAGAMFLVTPNLDLSVIAHARSRNIPVICGALTPTEVYQAQNAGADMIKVFPCGALGGAAYIRDLLGPFDTSRLVAVGGVTIENAASYLAAGAVAVGVSSSLFGRAALHNEDINDLEKNVKAFIDRCHIGQDVL